LKRLRPAAPQRRRHPPLAFATRYNYKVVFVQNQAEPALTIRLFFSAWVALLALGAAWAEKRSRAEGPRPQIHYAPGENLESLDARAIGRAQLSIDMAAYVLSDLRIIEALTDAAERGVVIRLYLDRSQFAEHGPARGGLIEALLAHPNVSARVKGEGVLMHLKAYAVDGEVLRTGSGNFSRSGLASQDNDAVFIADPGVVDAFEGNFERIWARAQNIGALDVTR
jgi:phosphatidylserine/phosphatidylglycerophosphate/cardiolipin synthase-like enzyme